MSDLGLKEVALKPHKGSDDRSSLLCGVIFPGWWYRNNTKVNEGIGFSLEVATQNKFYCICIITNFKISIAF